MADNDIESMWGAGVNYWPFEKGTTEIWYQQPGFFFESGRWYRNVKHERILPSRFNLKNTHILLGKVKEVELEEIFVAFQCESWSPKGQARTRIRSLGLAHTSMSIGDIIIADGVTHLVDIRGFMELTG